MPHVSGFPSTRWFWVTVGFVGAFLAAGTYWRLSVQFASATSLTIQPLPALPASYAVRLPVRLSLERLVVPPTCPVYAEPTAPQITDNLCLQDTSNNRYGNESLFVVNLYNEVVFRDNTSFGIPVNFCSLLFGSGTAVYDSVWWTAVLACNATYLQYTCQFGSRVSTACISADMLRPIAINCTIARPCGGSQQIALSEMFLAPISPIYIPTYPTTVSGWIITMDVIFTAPTWYPGAAVLQLGRIDSTLAMLQDLIPAINGSNLLTFWSLNAYVNSTWQVSISIQGCGQQCGLPCPSVQPLSMCNDPGWPCPPSRISDVQLSPQNIVVTPALTDNLAVVQVQFSSPVTESIGGYSLIFNWKVFPATGVSILLYAIDGFLLSGNTTIVTGNTISIALQGQTQLLYSSGATGMALTLFCVSESADPVQITLYSIVVSYSPCPTGNTSISALTTNSNGVPDIEVQLAVEPVLVTPASVGTPLTSLTSITVPVTPPQWLAVSSARWSSNVSLVLNMTLQSSVGVASLDQQNRILVYNTYQLVPGENMVRIPYSGLNTLENLVITAAVVYPVQYTLQAITAWFCGPTTCPSANSTASSANTSACPTFARSYIVLQQNADPTSNIYGSQTSYVPTGIVSSGCYPFASKSSAVKFICPGVVRVLPVSSTLPTTEESFIVQSVDVILLKVPASVVTASGIVSTSMKSVLLDGQAIPYHTANTRYMSSVLPTSVGITLAQLSGSMVSGQIPWNWSTWLASGAGLLDYLDISVQSAQPYQGPYLQEVWVRPATPVCPSIIEAAFATQGPISTVSDPIMPLFQLQEDSNHRGTRHSGWVDTTLPTSTPYQQTQAIQISDIFSPTQVIRYSFCGLDLVNGDFAWSTDTIYGGTYLPININITGMRSQFSGSTRLRVYVCEPEPDGSRISHVHAVISVRTIADKEPVVGRTWVACNYNNQQNPSVCPQ